MDKKIHKIEEEWRKILTPDQFRVLRQKGTEPAFDNLYADTKEKGVYRCAACGKKLFSSEAKYDSGTGWPSFFQPLSEDAVEYRPDGNDTEVVCARCGSHLGHIFDDGPKPTGKRYCMNSISLKLDK